MKIDDATIQKLWEAVVQTERKLNRDIPNDVSLAVLDHTVRKCERIGKGPEYLPLLFENELSDFYMRQQINAMGGMNRCAVFAE